MKITKRQLKRIIREERESLLAEGIAVRPELADYTEFLMMATTDRSAAVEWLKEQQRQTPQYGKDLTDEQYEQIVGITITSLYSMLRRLKYGLGLL